MFGCDLKTRLLWTLLAGSCAIGATSAQGQDNRFQQWDKNKDGQLVIEELPQQLRANFQRVDRNQDGFISQDEHNRFINRDRPATDQRQDKTYESHRDMAYVDNGHRRQKLDLFLPLTKSDKPLPLVIFVHGGGWKGGDKGSAPVREFIEAGFAVASLNYRLSQHAIFPAQINDCKTAVKWLRTNADQYNIDPNRFGAFGKSAGGHLVCLLGTTSHNDQHADSSRKPDNKTSRVQAVCSWYGPTELLTMNQQSKKDSVIDHDDKNSPESLLVGGALQTKKDLAKSASPLEHVTPDDASFLIMHGSRDRLVPCLQSESLHQKLKSNGVNSQLMVIPDAGHGFDRRKYLPNVIEFFQKELHESK